MTNWSQSCSQKKMLRRWKDRGLAVIREAKIKNTWTELSSKLFRVSNRCLDLKSTKTICKNLLKRNPVKMCRRKRKNAKIHIKRRGSRLKRSLWELRVIRGTQIKSIKIESKNKLSKEFFRLLVFRNLKNKNSSTRYEFPAELYSKNHYVKNKKEKWT